MRGKRWLSQNTTSYYMNRIIRREVITTPQRTIIQVGEVSNAKKSWYTAKEICELCNVDLKTFTNFMKIVNGIDSIYSTKNKIVNNTDVNYSTEGKIVNGIDSIYSLKHNETKYGHTNTACKPVNLYNEEVLKQFQIWLMRNQARQGKSSEMVKQSSELHLNAGIELHKAVENGLTEDLKTLELKLAIEKEITKQMRLVSKDMGFEKKFLELREVALKMTQYKNSDKTGVYIGIDTGYYGSYKIGMTTNISQRSVNGTTDHPRLQYIYYRKCDNNENAKLLEKELHKELAEYNLQNYTSEPVKSLEWFILKPEQIIDIVTRYGFEEICSI